MGDKSLFKLFISMLYLSAFTFGGGYTIVPLMQKKFVEEKKWIDKDEMMDLVSIAQSTPGAIAVNAAILVGYNTFGIIGAFVSLLGAVLPPLVIIALISVFYNFIKDNAFVSGFMLAVRATVSATIFAVVINMVRDLIKKKDVFLIIIMVSTFIASIVFDVNILVIVVVCILAGLGYTYFKVRKLREKA